jgi:Protein of unknown function DUF2625
VRPIDDLIAADDSAWPDIQAAAHSSPYPVELLPVEAGRGRECLAKVQVTTRSWLGAVVFYTGGMLIDHGWLRVFGSGDVERTLVDIVTANERVTGGLLVSVDVLGGLFSWASTADSTAPTIQYFAPESLEWEDLECGYQQWLSSMLSGSVSEFYSTLRWSGWEEEVSGCPLDRGIHTLPPPFTVKGKDLDRASRRPVPMTELTSLYAGIEWQAANR